MAKPPCPSHIYLSPHHDDIAFSLGAYSLDHGGGTIVNLFTRGAYTKIAPVSPNPDPETIRRTSAMRRAEDEAFCRAARLQRHDLGLSEPQLRGRHSRDPAGIPDDVAQLEAPLLGMLGRLFSELPAPRLLFCPAGIGGHANHLATRAVVIANLGWIESMADVMFYEDLHYAGRWRVRMRGLNDLKRAMAGRRGVREAWTVRDEVKKLELINLYASQHEEPVTTLGHRYSPAALWPRGAHEAVWRF